ncbi:NAD(P)H-quinone oxidoreductase subunit L [Halomicronema hongdechloris C2206]|uniref:NAD(P)H-quinone oxidoreductase subunit L n=1 Tax=Halomicronema hongdechloris C2206 TaxID=1641165 RepID=A0A1V8NLZ8_9CYAN|nr:NAD(P)H-quinone oxidoreductase subunit L [Halomicronema hongdechloris]ASC72046.1 NAD(P)H-quinone oxidoreductase subunit L [Halomicronema hongdechloris C2206]
MLVAALYLVLGGTYLLVVPGLLFLYLRARWYTAGSVERSFLYALVFAFFPGMLLMSPFLNFRPRKRNLAS